MFLTLFGARRAPNPRRVEIFLAEHGLFESRDYDFVDVDMSKLEHKAGGKYATPNQKLPSLRVRFDDGTEFDVAESVAICRYIEEAVVASRDNGSHELALFGRTPRERATIEMWNRRIELELLSGAIGKAWVNGPMLKGLREARGIDGHESELQLGLAAAQSFYREMDKVLSTRSFVAGDVFTIADVTLLCVLDFGAALVYVPMRWPELLHLQAWHERVSARESVKIHKNPYIKGEQRYDAYKDNGVWRPRGSKL